MVRSLIPATMLTVGCLFAAAGAADTEQTPLFVARADGYRSYRIPALVATARGTVLAFCEARKTSAADHGDIDLVLRRSLDGGKTWQPMQLVYEEGDTEPITIGNPCPIAAADGTIHLVFCRDNQEALAMHSADDGQTFSKPVAITDALRPFPFPFGRIGTGPVHGIQLSTGRLLVPLWLNDKIGHEYRSGVAYSDDGGATWKPGGLVPPDVTGLNECSVVELAGGQLMLNCRNRQAKCRTVSTSRDGGLTWSAPQLDRNLVDAQCQASLLRWTAAGRTRLLFSNAAARQREQLTVRASDDDGQTWSVLQVLHAGPAAYSDLAVAPDGALLCLYEGGEKSANEQILLARWKAE